jgi:hypothetical protein
MKVNSRIYKGIEYVELTDLPVDQQDKIKGVLTEDSIIKILIDKNIISNCIQYKDYLNWFEKNYSAEIVSIKRERPSGTPTLEVALGKI